MAKAKPQSQDDPTPPQEDVDAIRGGPGLEDDSGGGEPATPQTKKVKINGREFSVDEDLASTLSQRERDFEKRFSEQSTELGNLRKFYNEHQPREPAVQPPQSKYGTLIFEDPDAALERHKREVVEEVQKLYVGEKKAEAFWNKFYRENQDTLDRDEDDFMVRAIMQENSADLGQLPESKIGERLAELVQEKLLRYSRRSKLEDGERDEAAPRTRVESAGRTTQRVPAKEPEGPQTMTELIQANRARHRKTA